MAKVANPHKRFNFSIQVMDMNPFLAQRVQTPDVSVEAVAHGEGNRDIKTAGKKSFGNLIIDKIEPSSFSDTLFRDWLRLVQDEIIGGGSIPAIYKRTIIVKLFHTNGLTVKNQWVFGGCFPVSINGVELDRMSSDNTMTSIEFSVDDELYF